jgi:tetratricopeptide (TPR) repeat protein
MAYSLRSSSFALITTTVIVLAAAATPAFAQPMLPAMPSATPKPKQYPELKEALQRLKELGTGPLWSSGPQRPNPELPSAHVLMYQILSEMNQTNAARFELEVAVHEGRSDPEPYVILGNLALSERRIAEAAMDFDKSQALLKAYTNAGRKGAIELQILSGIAQVAEFREDWKEAETGLRAFLEKSPKDLLARQRLARCLFWQNKVQEAYKVLKDAKALDRENAAKPGGREQFSTPEAIMAGYYDQVEGCGSTTGSAETWYKAALRKAPNDLPTRLEVAMWALSHGTLDLVKEQADAALKIEAADNALPEKDRKYSRSSVGRMLRGLIALWEKDWLTAEKYFQTVVLEDPNDLVARNNLALALVEQDDPAKKQRALDYAKANYGDRNSTSDALWTLSWVYYRRGAFDLAGLAVEQAVKATKYKVTNADAATYLAHILIHQDKKWQAKEILDSALNAGLPFSMRPEAKKLYEKVKDAKDPEATPAAKTR